MRNLINTQTLIKAAIFIAGIIAILWPALYNGYPLVYSDTGTYLRSSVLLETPVDRPLGYGLFIRLTSWQAITWNVIFAQGIVIWIITFRVFRLYFAKPFVPHFITLFFLSFLSSLPWYASQLMPDIFSGVVILTVFLFFYDSGNWKKVMVYGILIGFFTMTHYSYFLISALTAGFIAILHVRKMFTSEKRWLFRLLTLGGFLGATVLLVMTLNYSEKGRFKFSFSSNVFLTAKFCEGGILNAYLQDNCGKKDIPFCELKDSVTSPSGFLWNSEFPFQKKYHANWAVVNERCAGIVNDVFSIPKYRKLFMIEAYNATRTQLQCNKIGSGLLRYKSLEGAPGDMIKSDFQSEVGQFLGSKQNNEDWENLRINSYNDEVLFFSLLIIIGGLLYRPLRQRTGVVIAVCIAGVVFNAFVTAALANVYDRLQARVTWLLVFGALIVILTLVYQKILKNRTA